jgi:hypothetical protein
MRTVELDEKTADELANGKRIEALGHRMAIVGLETIIASYEKTIEESRKLLQSARNGLASSIASYERLANCKLVRSEEDNKQVAAKGSILAQLHAQQSMGALGCQGQQNAFPRSNS